MKIWFHSRTGLSRTSPLAAPAFVWPVALERKTSVPRQVPAMSLEILGAIGLSFRVSQFGHRLAEAAQ